MPRVLLSERALSDLERLAGFLIQVDPGQADGALATILDALGVLARHPLIGRPIDGMLRELVVGHGRSGYVALYRHRPRLDRVEVLALRHQREAGYG